MQIKESWIKNHKPLPPAELIKETCEVQSHEEYEKLEKQLMRMGYSFYETFPAAHFILMVKVSFFGRKFIKIVLGYAKHIKY